LEPESTFYEKSKKSKKKSLLWADTIEKTKDTIGNSRELFIKKERKKEHKPSLSRYYWEIWGYY